MSVQRQHQVSELVSDYTAEDDPYVNVPAIGELANAVEEHVSNRRSSAVEVACSAHRVFSSAEWDVRRLRCDADGEYFGRHVLSGTTPHDSDPGAAKHAARDHQGIFHRSPGRL